MQNDNTSGELSKSVRAGLIIDSGKRWTHHRFNYKYDMTYLDTLIKRKQPLPADRFDEEQYVIMQPSENVRNNTTFLVHDIIDKPLPSAQDIIVINNVFLHFPDKTRDLIMRHVLESLRPGGFVVLEPVMTPMRNDEVSWLEPYGKWRKQLTQRFPLKPVQLPVWYSDKPVVVDGYFQFDGTRFGSSSV